MLLQLEQIKKGLIERICFGQLDTFQYYFYCSNLENEVCICACNDGLGILQICITSSTSAGLEQILPWLFYHKVIGVTTFFLFVEGEAAKPAVSTVLESIPVSSNVPFHPEFVEGTMTWDSMIYMLFSWSFSTIDSLLEQGCFCVFWNCCSVFWHT